MPLANVDPIFTAIPAVGMSDDVIGPTANTSQDGSSSSTSMDEIFQAHADVGSYVESVRLKSVGSPAATVFRLYLSSITGAYTMGTDNDETNTRLIAETSLPAITLSQTAASPQFEVPVNMGIPPGYRLMCSFGTSTGSAGTGYSVVVVAGHYSDQ